MGLLGSNRDKKRWSAISQKDRLKMWELQNEQTNLEAVMARCQRKIADAEHAAQSRLSGQRKGGDRTDAEVGQSLLQLDGLKRALAAYEQELGQIKSAIEALRNPTAARLAQRAEHQETLTGLARARTRKDGEIDAALHTLRRLLSDRDALTAKMFEAACAIDFSGKLENRVYQDLASAARALPESVGPQSEEWLNSFLGQGEDRRTYYVQREKLMLPETLATHGAYLFGEPVELSRTEFRELVSDPSEAVPAVAEQA